MTDLMRNLRAEAIGLFEKSGIQNRFPFLRRAQSDDYLLCSDAPRRLPYPAHAARLFQEAGLPFMEKGGLWLIDARAGDYIQLDSALPSNIIEKPLKEKYMDVLALCRMLSGHTSNAACQPLWAVRRTLKAIEAGETQVLFLTESLPPQLAVLLRKKEPLPSLAGKLLIQWLSGKM